MMWQKWDDVAEVGMMWHVFSRQREPVKKTAEMNIE
jgi:hypothetical protein